MRCRHQQLEARPTAQPQPTRPEAVTCPPRSLHLPRAPAAPETQHQTRPQRPCHSSLQSRQRLVQRVPTPHRQALLAPLTAGQQRPQPHPF